MLAWTIYLNDVPEGGETEFLYQSQRVSPEKGKTCIFPAGFMHTHRGNPPLKKDKYIATGWMEHAYIKNSNMKHPIAPADLDPKKQ